MKRNETRIVIKWFITVDLLLEYKDTITNKTMYDTNKWGDYAQAVYTIYSLPSGVSYPKAMKSGPRVDIRIVNVSGSLFKLGLDRADVIVGVEEEKIRAFFQTEKGRKLLHKPEAWAPAIKITDLLS